MKNKIYLSFLLTFICVFTGSAQWMSVTNGKVPEIAFIGAYQSNNAAVYIARAAVREGLHIGKITKSQKKATILYNDANVDTREQFDKFEVYAGTGLWVETNGKRIPRNAIEAGKDKNGNPIYIARALIYGNYCLGKIQPQYDNGARILVDAITVQTVDKYEVLTTDELETDYRAFQVTTNLSWGGDKLALHRTWLYENDKAILFAAPVYQEAGDQNVGYPLAVERKSGLWSIVHQNKAPITSSGSGTAVKRFRFNVLAFKGENNRVFVHTASKANTVDWSTTLAHPALNGNPDAAPIIMQRLEEGDSINDHPIGVQYENNTWRIVNLDRAPIPDGSKFNVFVASSGPINAGQAIKTINTSENSLPTQPAYSTLNHAFLNGNPNVLVFPTQNATTVFNPAIINVWYDKPDDGYNYNNSKWLVYNANAPMPINSGFNVVCVSANTPDVNDKIVGGEIYLVNGQSSLALEQRVENGGNETQVTQRCFEEKPPERWQIAYVSGEGGFRIKNKKTGLYLNVKNNSAGEGEAIIVNTNPNTTWLLKSDGFGVYKLQSKTSQKFIAVAQGSSEEGAYVLQWTDVGQHDIKWVLNPTADKVQSNPVLQLQMTMTRPIIPMSVRQPFTESCLNARKGAYFIRLTNGKALEAKSDQAHENGCPIQIGNFTGAPNQRWEIEPKGNSCTPCQFIIRNAATGKVLDADQTQISANGGRIMLHDNWGGNNQYWRVLCINCNTPTLPGAIITPIYKILPLLSDKVLDVSGNRVDQNGTPVILWGYSASGNQQWVLEEVTDDSYWGFENGNLDNWKQVGFIGQPHKGDAVPNTWRNSYVPLGGDYWKGLEKPPYYTGYFGNYWVTSSPQDINSNEGAQKTGVLYSKEFTLNKKYISYLVGGASAEGRCRVELLLKDGSNPAVIGEKSRTVLVFRPPPAVSERVVISMPERTVDGQKYTTFGNLGGERSGSDSILQGGSTNTQERIWNIQLTPILRRAYFEIPERLMGAKARIAIFDEDIQGHINVDDFRFENTLSADFPLEIPKQPLWGIVDMHTHIAGHLAFGGNVFHGSPYILGSTDGNIGTALHNCNAAHKGWDLFSNKEGDHEITPVGIAMPREFIINEMEDGLNKDGLNNKKKRGNTHIKGVWGDGDRFADWPTFYEVSHQEMWWEWVKRAYDGGLRVIVALAHHNQALAKACTHHGRFPNEECDDWAVLNAQIAYMRDLFSPKCPKIFEFAEIAYSPSDLRSIVNRGKMAVVLGSEMDNIGVNFYEPYGSNDTKGGLYNRNPTQEQIKTALKQVHDLGVRYIFPVHLADNIVGGTAIYSEIFEMGQKYYAREKWNVGTGEAFELAPLNGCGSTGGIAGGGHNIWDITGMILKEISLSLHFQNGLGTIAPALVIRGIHFDLLPELPGNYTNWGNVSKPWANHKGLNTNGKFILTEMMNFGFMIDIDHMSEKSIIETSELLKNNNYPINSGHTGFKEMGHGDETGRSPQQINDIVETGGLMGIGWGCGDILPFSGVVSNPSFVESTVVNDAAGSAKTFSQSYLYALEKFRRKGVAFGTDINSMVVEPAPRFGNYANYCLNSLRESCRADFNKAQFNPVKYFGYDRAHPTYKEFMGIDGMNEPLMPCGTLEKYWSINTDGVAHYGLLPDFIQDMKNVGVTSKDLTPMFMGAEYFAQMWEKCELLKK